MALSQNVQTSPLTASSATAELIAVSSLPVTPFGASTSNANGPSQGTVIRGLVNATLGTGATTVVGKVHAGTATSGATLNTFTVTTTAVTTVHVPFFAVDTTAIPSSQYSLSIATPGGTGGVFAVVNYAEIEVDLVQP